MDRPTTQTLAAQHYPLVRSIVRRMARSLPAHVGYEELVGDGSVGLVEAARRFSSERKVEFRTFAVRRIKGAILDALRGRSRRGRGVERRHRELTILEERLTGELGRRPEPSDFAAAGLPAHDLARRRRESAHAQTVPLFEPDQTEERLACPEPGPELCLLNRERRQALKAGMARLSVRERQILDLYYFQHWTVRRIGELLGVTEARISQIHGGCLKKLRNSPELQALSA